MPRVEALYRQIVFDGLRKLTSLLQQDAELVMRLKMARVERASLLVQHGRTPAGRTISTDRLRAVDGGTELTVRIEYTLRGGPLGRLFDAVLMQRAMQHAIGQSLAKLKALAEG